MDLHLSQKVAIITGSSRGLGLASARALHAEGCRVVLCARGRELLAAAVESFASDRVHSVVADVSTPDGADQVVAETLRVFGRVDILVNNVAKAGGAGIDATDDDVWHEAIDQTLFPAIRLSRLVVPHMRMSGGGVILIIASIWGRESGGRMTYNVVKADEITLAKSMAQSLAKDHIRVNSVAPGSISFEGGSWWKRQQDDPAGIAAFVEREIPMGRFGRADEVGDVVAYLGSDRASWITGACVLVDGGQGRANI